MTLWHPPEGVIGNPFAIKVSVGMLGPAKYRCPAADAMKARQGLRPAVRRPWKPEVLEQVTNGPFMTAMDLIEHSGKPVEEALSLIGTGTVNTRNRPVHDGVRQWTAHAIEMYQQAFPSDAHATADERMVPATQPWTYHNSLMAPDHRGVKHYQITVWGRCYVSADGKTRELRMLTNRLDSRERTDAEVAVTALVVAEGTPGPPPEHVRIVQFGGLEGRARTLFEGTRAAALEIYCAKGKQALGDIVDSQTYRPGTACADCAYAHTCPALARAPGLLGITDRTRPRRTWSVTNGRTYLKCPAREHLRRHRLPVDGTIERGPAPERGRAIHAYLKCRHTGNPRMPCDPDVGTAWAIDEVNKEWVPYPRLLLSMARNAELYTDPVESTNPVQRRLLTEREQQQETERRIRSLLFQVRDRPTLLLANAGNLRKSWQRLRNGALIRDMIGFGDDRDQRLATLGPDLRFVLVRDRNNREEVPQWYAPGGDDDTPGFSLGLWAPVGAGEDNRVFASTADVPPTVKGLRRGLLKLVPSADWPIGPTKTAWNPQYLEMIVLGCLSPAALAAAGRDDTRPDQPATWAAITHQLRFLDDYVPLSRPLPLHLAKLVEQYVLPTEVEPVTE